MGQGSTGLLWPAVWHHNQTLFKTEFLSPKHRGQPASTWGSCGLPCLLLLRTSSKFTSERERLCQDWPAQWQFLMQRPVEHPALPQGVQASSQTVGRDMRPCSTPGHEHGHDPGLSARPDFSGPGALCRRMRKSQGLGCEGSILGGLKAMVTSLTTCPMAGPAAQQAAV